MEGFRLRKLSDLEIDSVINGIVDAGTTIGDAVGYSYNIAGHPMYVVSFPAGGITMMYDGSQQVWTRLTSTDGGRHWGAKFTNFLNQRILTDYRNGQIYKIDPTLYTDNGSSIPMEVQTKHIWDDDKYLGIQQLQVDMQPAPGLAVGQGSNPQVMLYVSKDGGNSFTEIGWSSAGPIGEYTQRVIWRSLGGARDWVLKLRITDPVMRVITGASAEIIGGSF
jgi:hypothetical protein